MCQCNNYCPCCGQRKNQYQGHQYEWPYTWPNQGPSTAGSVGQGYVPVYTTTDGFGQKYDQFGVKINA